MSSRSENEASGMLDPQPVVPASLLTTTSPGAGSSVIRPQPSLYSFAEFLNDPRNLPPTAANQPSELVLHKQPSQLSLRQILAEDPPAEFAQGQFSIQRPSSGPGRSVSRRIAEKVRTLVSPRKEDGTSSSAYLTSAASAEELREQKTNKKDEQYAQSEEEAVTSISVGLDGSYLFRPPPSYPTITPTTAKPSPSLPFSPPSSTFSPQPQNRGRNRNTTIRPSYEITAPSLPQACPSSTSTTKTNQTSANIGIMSSSANDTARAQRIPLVCPPWDRRVDLTWARGHNFSWDGSARELSAFGVSIAQFQREMKHTPTGNDIYNPLVSLPDRVRYMIAKYLVPDADPLLPIKLNSGTRLYEPAWPAPYFDNLGDVLRAVRPCTEVCWTMRADILMTLANTRKFHVVLSPFSGPLTDPLAHHWFGRYAGYIQHLAIELDFTKLGFGADPAAASLKPLVSQIAPRMKAYAIAQRERGIQQDLLLKRDDIFGRKKKGKAAADGGGGGPSTVHSLTVAVRRYFGERPVEAGRVPQKYSPDEYLAVLGPAKALCGKVDHLRVVGIDADSAHRLIALVWAEGMTAESVRTAVACGRFGAVRATCPSDFYPTLPGQASFFDDGTGEGENSSSSARRGCSFVRHPFAFEDGRMGFYIDEDMVAAEAAGKGRGAHSSIAPSALGEPASKKERGVPGPASGRDKGKGKETAVQEREVAPEWPEEREETGTGPVSRGSSTETEPFPALPDMDLQLALLRVYETSQAAWESVILCPSPERQQGEAGEEQMPGTSSSSSGGGGRVMGRVAGRMKRKISRFNPRDSNTTSQDDE